MAAYTPAVNKKKAAGFACSACGNAQPRWLGRCPECGGWNTFRESAAGTAAGGEAAPGGNGARPVPLASVDPSEGRRISTGSGEFDRVLGGGATLRSAILVGGEPGIGKSTLLLQTAAAVSRPDGGAGEPERGAAKTPRALYVSGEESAAQIRARADRLMLDTRGIDILCATRLEDVCAALDALQPDFVVIDSIQTLRSAEAGAVPGTVSQLKYCALELVEWAKSRDSVLCMSAHVTKDGSIAGPKSLEHLVDTVVAFERNSDEARFLRAQKNRYGSVDELGIFAMGERGLTQVEDPSAMFITRRTGSLPAGVAAAPVFEGSRVFLVEIQALTVPAKAALSRVYSDRIDSARVSRTAAVLEKRTGVRFSDQDIYINVGGGIRLTESAIDAALAAALYSARTDLPLAGGTAFVGEMSLAGEIRPVPRVRQRAKTAASLGFAAVYAPEAEAGVIAVADVRALIHAAFGVRR